MENSTHKIQYQRAYPRGVLAFFFIIGFYMFAFVMTNALLVLYLTQSFAISNQNAVVIVAAYMSLFYSASLLGGYLGDRFDHKLAVIVGSCLSIIGYAGMLANTLPLIYTALACFIIGNGLIVPNTQCIFGKLYAINDHRRDSGYTINYVGMNIGAFTAAISSGYIVHSLGFHSAFVISDIVSVLGLITLLWRFKHMDFYSDDSHRHYHAHFKFKNLVIMLFMIVIAVIIVKALLTYSHLSNWLLLTLGIAMIAFITRLGLKQQKMIRKRVVAFIIITLLSLGFWMLYMLAPSVLTLFVKYNLNRLVFGSMIPTASVYSLNPLTILTVGIITSQLFLYLGRHNKDISLPGKLSLAILLMGLAYLVLSLGIYLSGNGLIAFIWIVLSYLLQSVGELFIGPIGFAMVGRLAPPGQEGLLMGFYQLSLGVAGALSGFLAGLAVAPSNKIDPMITNPYYFHAFMLYGALSVAIAMVAFLMKPYINHLISTH